MNNVDSGLFMYDCLLTPLIINITCINKLFTYIYPFRLGLYLFLSLFMIQP